MFSLQQGYELVFQPPLVFQSDQILQDLIMDHTLLNNSSLNTRSGEKGQQKSVSFQENKGESTFDESYIRKLVHRDIERQRRQEMTKLYASLRSLVPPEYLKGKRSISDHMQEAINYIRDMKINIRELQIRRDKLKKLSNSGNLKAEVGSSTCCSSDLVTVNPCLDGIEILISCSFKLEGEFPLSKVLTELLGRGLNVVSCVSTKANERSLHRIQCEATNFKCNDLSTLQERLAEVIKIGRETPYKNV
ncbi:unnamed protein product [Fraxinus pennsylvanica]|uniref:BHLH domain-containing protein n=1 Tax=Fraxinus pennsylvanica TaxID=56036 RepID=A0AAD1ZHW1_9LAMI|nr:unnamed protein product [Fraxinus pennsylvanica]